MTLEPNIYDKATERTLNLHQKVKGRLREQFKGTKPYRTEPLSPDEELYWYRQLSQDDMFRLIEKHGEDEANALIMRNELQKRKNNAT